MQEFNIGQIKSLINRKATARAANIALRVDLFSEKK
jgi:hypothetical protein